MKTIRIPALSALLLSSLLCLSGCKKNDDVNPSQGLSARIQTIVTPEALSDLKAKGLVVNEGSQPPNIEGIFIINPMQLLSPYGPNDTFAKGRIISDYKYRFYEQSADGVKMDFKNTNTDAGTGQGAFISGFGNKFTLFVENVGRTGSIDYKSVRVVSGEISSNGIINFQVATTLTSKTGDSNDVALIPINQARVWEDGNKLASKTTSFRLAANPEVSPQQATVIWRNNSF